ncbi:hypothetical protein KUF83_30640 [Streptomyces sp. BV286]|uniref:hypothetical protein n=1 Tax=Streptomyces sp. BV286 TaxID=2849672 RepID=UPI001C2EE459|nr:hypothetical protein [Streptomyces sp. BV286]MBV1940893.1 hypothetical protein [Streptomyces sp. BV286]
MSVGTFIGGSTLMAATHGTTGTFLGEDLVGWRTALIAAAIAALAYEAILALLRKLRPGARFMTLRLPFVVLWLARLTVSPAAWAELHGPLKADLWDVLEDDERGTLRRFCAGMAFSSALAFGGASRTARALELSPAQPARTRPAPSHPKVAMTRRRRRIGIGAAVISALAGLNGPALYRFVTNENPSGETGTAAFLAVVGVLSIVCLSAAIAWRVTRVGRTKR